MRTGDRKTFHEINPWEIGAVKCCRNDAYTTGPPPSAGDAAMETLAIGGKRVTSSQ